jgi:hypothetical protein
MAWVEENEALGRPLDHPGTKQEMGAAMRRDMAEATPQRIAQLERQVAGAEDRGLSASLSDVNQLRRLRSGRALKARLVELGHATEAAAMGVVEAPRDTFGYAALKASVAGEVDRLAAGGPDERASAVFLRLHRGDSVFPGQPKALRQPVRAGRVHGMGNVKGSVPRAFADLVRHHGVFRGAEESPCPTCKRIAAYVDVRGVGQGQVESVVDDLVEEMRQRWLLRVI